MKVRWGAAPIPGVYGSRAMTSKIPWRRFPGRDRRGRLPGDRARPVRLPADRHSDTQARARKPRPHGDRIVRRGPLSRRREMAALEQQLRGLGPVLGELGAKYINLIHECYSDARTGEQTSPKELDDESWKHMVETFVRAAEIARDEYGLRLCCTPSRTRTLSTSISSSASWTRPMPTSCRCASTSVTTCIGAAIRSPSSPSTTSESSTCI